MAGKINKRIRKENFFVIFIFFVSYMFFLVVTLINDVTRLDLLSFILVSQLLFFLLISCTLQVSFPSGKYFLTYESTKIKIIFFLLSAFFVFFVIYLNQHLGGAHSLINQNWLMIAFIEVYLLGELYCVVTGRYIKRAYQLTYISMLALLAFSASSLGVGLTAVFLVIVSWLRLSGRFTIYGITFGPLLVIFLLVHVTDFRFNEINDFLNYKLDSPIPIDYSSGRFMSWDLALAEFRSNPQLLYLGGGLDNASNLYFSDFGITASGHNLWIETTFRIGLIGLVLIFLPYIYVYEKLKATSSSKRIVNLFSLSYVSLFSLGFFYDVGGLTHLPGTLFFKAFPFIVFAFANKERVLKKTNFTDSTNNCNACS
ncbi:hypothetical protein [Idiomarina sp.]|uniref:hypothetical protein n=1 Tax=Idiomarina sp. TaxID=1874361 RepID=UPI001D2DEAB1|nr:hypothetical protein [Idiomarina sp.]MCJ8316214.1 hypothetical protein [Idiomarina sp.]NQZ16127.1 hypothetical protein [Idiomarina sp.]